MVVLAVMFVAANTAAMSVRERRSEIAVMRAIGFGPRSVFASVVTESILISAVGGLLGCAIGYLALKILALNSAALLPVGMPAFSMP